MDDLTGKHDAEAVTMAARRSLQQLTMDDSKILGKVTGKRREKTLPAAKYNTRNFQTLTSKWTPLVHKPSNDQIFLERRDLVSDWYELWTDSQRKRFLDQIFRRSRRSQLFYVQQWFRERVPMRHLDFSTVLPRFLSLYIFSFLDPRSLSRAAMVSWNWKFLTEQDAIWIPKCQRRGWYLPYTPADNEYAAWKRHYVACIQTMDMDVLAKNPNNVITDLADKSVDNPQQDNELYGTRGDGTNLLMSEKKKKGNKLTIVESRAVLHSRPPWIPPDRTPRDTHVADKAMLAECNPNDPMVHSSLTTYHNKFGIVKTGLMRQSAPAGLRKFGLNQDGRHTQHHIVEAEGDPDLRPRQNTSMSQSLRLETYEERRMMELVHQPWEPPVPTKQPVQARPNLAGGGDYPTKQNHRQQISKSYPSQANPRIVFISSRVPAAEVLVDAVMFGVIPIVYEYEGTTLESLMSQITICLQGRHAKSVGIFAHSEYPWEMRLVHGATISLDNLDTAEFIEFFQNLANLVLPPSQGGHIDFFVPLASCEPGTELMFQLQTLTGMTYSAPTGIIGNYNHVNSDWSSKPEGVVPPTHYFCSSKMNVWANTADQVKEACQVTKQLVNKYFDQKHKDIVSQFVGQIVFDATGQIDIQGLKDISETLVEGLVQIGKQQNKSDEEGSLAVGNPLEYLARYFLQKADAVKPGEDVDDALARSRRAKKLHGGTLAPTQTLGVGALSGHLELDERYDESLQNSEYTDDYDNEVAQINSRPSKKNKDKKNQKLLDDGDSDVTDDIPEDIHDDDDYTPIPDDDDETEGFRVIPPKPKRSKSPSTTKASRSGKMGQTGDWEETLQSYSSLPGTSRKSHDIVTTRRLTAEQLQDHPEKRPLVAKEILASEVEYMRTLSILDDVFVIPLRNALATNRAALSAPNLQIIFADPLNILELSRGLVSDLRRRLSDWGPQQCLGDIFVKFTSNLKTYVNFLNNYPTILTTIERSAENAPLFRAFLKRHERTAATKMLTLTEILLLPCRRISEYATLLTWFQTYTPKDHADRNDIKLAVKSFVELDDLIRQCKLRSERERELMSLQKRIISCPVLLEANRHLIKQEDVVHLKPPSDSELPQLRGYQHIETLGLFLCNDGLVVTRRTNRQLPFERAREYNYRFQACCALTRLRVDDIPDSKYVRNAFRMYTPRRSWVCQTEDFDTKFNWMTLLENTIRAALEDLD